MTCLRFISEVVEQSFAARREEVYIGEHRLGYRRRNALLILESK
jgi:hypothetical protein